MVMYSFILVCYNNWSISNQAINTLIESLEDISTKESVEIIIINNGSTDETASELAILKEKYLGQIYLNIQTINENMGYIVALNNGLSLATGEIITILNNDLIFTNKWFELLVEPLLKYSDIGVTAPMLSSASGIQNLGVKLNNIEEIRSFSNKLSKSNQELIITPRVISACLAINRNVLIKVGGFDFWFGLGMFDDDDWCLRVMIAGYKIVVVSNCFVYHLGSVTFNKNQDTLNAAMLANEKKFNIKWNNSGDFSNVYNIANNLCFNRLQYYYPTSSLYFNYGNMGDEKISSETSVLLIADWSNTTSKWRNKVITIIEGAKSIKDIFFFIPKNYYVYSEVENEIVKIIKEKYDDLTLIPNLNLIYDMVYPLDLLKCIKSFGAIIKVEDDFVNKYFISLAKGEKLRII